MTSVGVAGSTKMESWMVDILFAQPEQDKAAPPAAGPTAVSAVSVASAARSAVASGTGQAMAALQAGGSTVAPDAGVVDTRYLTVAQSNAVVASNNAMTSAQISAALYSGQGLKGLGTGEMETFASMMQLGRDSAQYALDLANDPVAAAAVGRDPQDLREEAVSLNAFSDSMQKALDNHTLIIQKLADVPGLNFTQREIFLGPGQDSQPEGMTWTGNYEAQAMRDFMSQFKDGKHGATPFIGGVTLLTTSSDDNLH